MINQSNHNPKSRPYWTNFVKGRNIEENEMLATPGHHTVLGQSQEIVRSRYDMPPNALLSAQRSTGAYPKPARCENAPLVAPRLVAIGREGENARDGLERGKRREKASLDPRAAGPVAARASSAGLLVRRPGLRANFPCFAPPDRIRL
jgi:hypothetical protein